MACIQMRVPGASVITEPATRPNQSKPLTAPATSSAVARPHTPATSSAHAATTPHWTITIGTPSSIACTRCSRTAASTRPPSTSRRWACTSGVAAASLTVRTESSAETSDRPKRARAADDAAAERPATVRPSEDASADDDHHREQDAAGEEALGDDRGQRRDREAVDEVDPAVGVPRQPVGVHGAGDDLAGRGALQAVLLRLADEHRRPDAQHDRDPPARVAPDRGRQQERRDQQRHDQCGRQRRRAVAALERDDQVTPDPAGHRAEGAGDRGDQEEHEARRSPTRARRRARRAWRAPGPGPGATSGAAGGSPVRRAVPTRVVSARVSAVLLLGRRLEQGAERTGLGGQARSQTALDDPATVEDGDLLGALGRRQPVGDQQAGATGEQAVGGAHDAGLGDRVHPGGGLVEDDDAHVADQQPGERDQLLLAGRQGGAARAEQGVEPVGQPGDPVGQPELVDRGLDVGARDAVEERDVLGQGAGQDLGALGDHADGATQQLEVEVEHVDAAEQHRAGLGLDRAREQRGQRRLAGAGAADQGAGGAGRDVQVDVLQRERAVGVGEVEVAELDLQRAVGQLVATDRLALGAEQVAQPDHGAEAGLQVGQVAGELVDLADEHRRDQEERDQRGRVEVVADDEHDADEGGGGEHAVQQRAGAARDPGLERDDVGEAVVHAGGELGAPAQHVGLPRLVRRSSRAAMPSSSAAAWSVQAISSTTLRAETRGSSGRTDEEGGRPRRAGRARTPATR